ncbi:MAG: VWA domain-containing protein [Pyrinomonadaceae bacterium]
MKIFAVGLFFILGFFSIASAQSGRKVKTEPTPNPIVETTTPEAGDYSESTPNKPIPIYVEPSKKKSKKKPEIKQPEQTAPVQQTTTETNDEDVVKVETNLITIPVSVFDRNGLYIPNLRQSDFEIYENGVKQDIAYFGSSDKPFTVVLLLDTSPSTAYKIEEIQNAARAFVDQLKSQDNVMVIEFDWNVHVLTEATNDRQKIYKAIKKTGFGNGTSLYDAVHFSFAKRLNEIEGRKAIVLFTDGVDTTSSKAEYESTIREAEEADALVFPIYYNTFFGQGGLGNVNGGIIPTATRNQGYGTSSEEYARGRSYLQDLAAATGGRVFRPESTPGGLTAAFEGIAEELRRQYNIGYYPNEEAQAGQRKQIKVRVNRPSLVIRARDSYIVGANPPAAKTQSN